MVLVAEAETSFAQRDAKIQRQTFVAGVKSEPISILNQESEAHAHAFHSEKTGFFQQATGKEKIGSTQAGFNFAEGGFIGIDFILIIQSQSAFPALHETVDEVFVPNGGKNEGTRLKTVYRETLTLLRVTPIIEGGAIGLGSEIQTAHLGWWNRGRMQIVAGTVIGNPGFYLFQQLLPGAFVQKLAFIGLVDGNDHGKRFQRKRISRGDIIKLFKILNQKGFQLVLAIDHASEAEAAVGIDHHAQKHFRRLIIHGPASG